MKQELSKRIVSNEEAEWMGHQGSKPIMTRPITRVNTINLPDSDSLVRASQEPLQAQETVLLSAAKRPLFLYGPFLGGLTSHYFSRTP